MNAQAIPTTFEGQFVHSRLDDRTNQDKARNSPRKEAELIVLTSEAESRQTHYRNGTNQMEPEEAILEPARIWAVL